MALNLPSWATDWKAAVLALDGRLSPELERLVRTDEVLDAITVTHSLSRLIGPWREEYVTASPDHSGCPRHARSRSYSAASTGWPRSRRRLPPNRIEAASPDEFR